MIDVKSLSVTFSNNGRAIHAVRDISLHVAEGESFGIVGESGSGKSTILKTIAGLVAPDKPAITIAGQAVGLKRSKAEIGRAHV